ncbi:MAG: hypothetical protein EB059_05720 [Alphaproteobacteria bacterium]|nr:hypothetical protein [Alphaproteobacteria bacterium]
MLAPLLYMLALGGIGAAVMFSGYSQVLRSNAEITAINTARQQLNAAGQTLSASSKLDDDTSTIVEPPLVGAAGDASRLPANYASVVNATNEMNSDGITPITHGVMDVGTGVRQLDPWGKYYVYCRWTNPTASPSLPSIGIITAGPDGILQTGCGNVTAQGDDRINRLTVAEAINRANVWQVTSANTVKFGIAADAVKVNNDGSLNASSLIIKEPAGGLSPLLLIRDNANTERFAVASDGTVTANGQVNAISLALSNALPITSGGTNANNIIDARANLGSTTVGDALFIASTAAAARSTLGSTTVGDALFIAADAGAGRTALGATTVGNALFIAADAGAGRTALGATTVGDALFIASTAAAARATLGSTTVGDALFVAADAGAGRTALALGTMATQNADAVAITGGTITGVAITGNVSGSAGSVAATGITGCCVALASGGTGVNATSNTNLRNQLGIDNASNLLSGTLSSALLPQISPTSSGTYNWGEVDIYGRVVVAHDVAGSTAIEQGDSGVAVDDNAGTGGTVKISTDGAVRMTIDPSGNVGIGTQTPADKLDVNGNIRVRGPKQTDRSVVFSTLGSARWALSENSVDETGSDVGSNFVITRYSDAGTSLGNVLAITRSTGAISTSSDLTVGGAITATSGFYGTLYGNVSGGSVGAAGSNGQIQFNNSGNLGADSVFTWDNTNKRLGIGTTTPSYKLHIVDTSSDVAFTITAGDGNGNGTAINAYGAEVGVNGTASDGIGVRGYGVTHGVSGNATTGIGGYFSSTSGYALVTGTGNVGIGTAAPTKMLEVNGDIKTNGTSGNYSVIGYNASYAPGDTYNTYFGNTANSGMGIFLNYTARNYLSNSTLTNGSLSFADGNSDLGMGIKDAGVDSRMLALFNNNTSVGSIRFDTGGNTGQMYIDAAGSVGVGTTAPDATALLDLTSTTRGMLPPRMSNAQRNAISSPTTGLTVYNTTTKTLDTYNGSTWIAVGSNSVAGVNGEVQFNNNGVMGADSAFIWDATNHRLGIGTGAPLYPLHAVGTEGGKFLGTTGAALYGAGVTYGGNFTASGGVGVNGSGTTYGGNFTASAGPGIASSGTTYGISATASDAVGIGGYFTNTGGGYALITGAGNVGIGSATPEATALVDMYSTTQGFLPPRLTTTQRDAISSPATGLTIYNSTTNAMNSYNGSAWVLSTGAASLTIGSTAIASGADTKVLYDNNGTLGEYSVSGTGNVAMTTSPTFTTSITTPLINGGTGASSTLTLQSTSGTGTSDALIFKTGSQAEAMRIATNGFVGIGTSGPSAPLDIQTNNTAGALVENQRFSFSDTNYYSSIKTSTGGLVGQNQIGFFITEGGVQTNPLLLADNLNTITGTTYINGSVGVGTATPAATALLDISSTTKGFLPPRLTTTERDAISSPATGLTIYNTTTAAMQSYNGSAWGSVAGGAGSVSAAGSNTQIQFNSSGGLGADSLFNWDNTNKNLAVGTTAPAATALVDMTSTTKGMLPPRMTTAQRNAISSPATGLTVYNTTTGAMETYNGSAWGSVAGGAGSISAAGSAGQIQFNSGGNLGADSAFFWDNTNKRLGIGSATPGTALDVVGGVFATNASGTAFQGSGTNYGGYFTGSAGPGVTGAGSSYGGYFNGSAGPGVAAWGTTYGISATASGASGIGGYFTNTGGGYALVTGTGYVGIASSTPTVPLDIVGAAKITMGSAVSALTISTVYNADAITISKGGAYGGNGITVTDTGGSNSIAITKSTGAATINGLMAGIDIQNTYQHTGSYGMGRGLNIAVTNNTGATGSLYGAVLSATANTAGATAVGLSVTSASSSGNSYAALFNGGNVGIASSTPTVPLDVVGAIAGSSTLTLGKAAGTAGKITLTGSTSGTVALQAAAAAGSTTYTLPSADGTSGQLLSTNGSGTLSWAAVPTTALSIGTTGITGGTAGKVLFESATNKVSQDSLFHFDATNKRLGIGTATPTYRLDVYASGDLFAGQFINASGRGVYAEGTTYGAQFGVTGANATGIYAAGAGTGYGGQFVGGARGVDATGTAYGGYFTGSAGPGVYGTGTTYGVYGIASAGPGAYASGTTYGVYGTASSASGIGGYFTNTGGGYALVTDTGNVGIGSLTPASKLDVVGAIAGSSTLTLGKAAGTAGKITLTGSTSGTVALQAAAAAGSTTYTLPSADGSSGQMLSTNGSGTLSWAAAPTTALSIGTTAITGGTAGRVLFESATNKVDEDSLFVWDATNNRLAIGTTSASNALDVVGSVNVTTTGTAVTGTSTAASWGTGATFTAANASGVGVSGTGGGRGGDFTSSAGYGVVGTGPVNGGYFTSTGGSGVYGSGTIYGGNFSGGYGVNGSGTYGVYGTGTAGPGVYGTGTTQGGWFVASAGSGVVGTGTTYGGYLTASAGPGVYAAGTTYGISATASSASGIGGYFTNSGGGYALITDTGRVGIASSAPTVPLDVVGAIAGSSTLTLGKAAGTAGKITLTGSTSGTVALQAAAAAGSTTYTLPSADGTSGQALSTNGSGTLSWATPSASVAIGTTAITGGTAGKVLFESATNKVSEDSLFHWDATNDRLGVGTASPAHTLDAYNSAGTYAGNFVSTVGNGIAVYGTGAQYGGYFSATTGVYGTGTSNGGFFSGSNYGVQATGANFGGYFVGTNNTGVIGSGASYGGSFTATNSVGVTATGPIGGSFTGNSTRGISVGGVNYGIYSTASGGPGIYAGGTTIGGQFGASAGPGIDATGTTRGVVGTASSASGIGGYFTNSSSGYALVTGTGNVGIASATPTVPLDVVGAIVGSSTLTLGKACNELGNSRWRRFDWYDCNYRRYCRKSSF